MEELIEKYLEAAKPVLTAQEIMDNYSLVPIKEGGVEVGFFALQFSDLEKLGEMAIIEGGYLEPEYAGKGLRVYLPQLFMHLQDAGIKWVQADAEPTIAKFMERRYGIKPKSHRYIEPIERFTGGIN